MPIRHSKVLAYCVLYSVGRYKVRVRSEEVVTWSYWCIMGLEFRGAEPNRLIWMESSSEAPVKYSDVTLLMTYYGDLIPFICRLKQM